MNIRLAIAVFGACALLSAFELRAGEAPASPDGAVGTNTVSLVRDPFWPPGWEPPPPVSGPSATNGAGLGPRKVIPATRWDEARASLHMTGLSRGLDGKYFAILKGIGVVEQGDVVSVNFMAQKYKWKITSVTDKGIVTERIGVYPIK